MSPIALGLMMGAGSSSKAVRRLGTSRVVAAGLSGLALLLARPRSGARARTPSCSRPGSSGWRRDGLGDGSGDRAVIGAVPAAKTGVASATNTVARMVSGALGVAVVGSLVSSLYSGDVEGSLDALPPARRRPPSPRSALRVRSGPTSTQPSLGPTRDDWRRFTQAMGTGLLVAAALAGAIAVIVVRFLPPASMSKRNPLPSSSPSPPSFPLLPSPPSLPPVRTPFFSSSPLPLSLPLLPLFPPFLFCLLLNLRLLLSPSASASSTPYPPYLLLPASYLSLPSSVPTPLLPHPFPPSPPTPQPPPHHRKIPPPHS